MSAGHPDGEYDFKQANALRIICAACLKLVDVTDHATTVCADCRERRWVGLPEEDDDGQRRVRRVIDDLRWTGVQGGREGDM